MDEYRPFPSELPLEDDSTPEVEPALEEGGLEERPAPGEHPDRPAPNLDHPGGHLHGTVARLNRPRRFGFLRADDGTEVFFHASALDTGPNAYDGLRPGQEVEFDCHQDESGRGLAATLVTITGEPPEPRQPRQRERGEKGERSERGSRKGGGAGWHVDVLHDRQDASLKSQLERLLNDRNVKPGNFSFSIVEGDDAPECWVAYFQEGKKG
jgi:cold shock CspA family protein